MPIEQTESTPMTLRDHIAAESAPIETPAPEQKAPALEPVKETADPEIEAASTKPDADLSEAARTLRRNRADERKAKIQREIAEGVREREQTRAELAREREELARLRAERESLSRGTQPRSATAGAPPTDPNDPEPQEADYQDYSHFVADKARWAAREEMRRQQFQSRDRIARQASERSTQEMASKLESQHEETREKYADFDVVLEPVLASLRGTSRGLDAAQFFASSEVGGEVAYRLGKDAAALKSVAEAPNRAALHRALTHVEADILAARKAPKPTTSAPAPPSQTVTSSATTATLDTRKGVPLKDHIRIEEAEIAERRKQGYRY